MTLITKRATGKLLTTATWIREFVQNHPDYQQDSVISNSIAYDLVMEMKAIGEVCETSRPEWDCDRMSRFGVNFVLTYCIRVAV